MTVRDGSDINSPAILSADINNGYGTVNNPIGTVMTSKERMTIEVRHIYYTSDVQFELLSVMPGTCVL